MRIRNTLGALVLAIGSTTGATTASADEVQLKAASFLPPHASYGWPFARWVENVNEQCEGLVDITIVGPDAIKAFEQPNALKTGVIDMMNGPPAYYKGIFVEGDTAVLSEIRPAEMRENGAWEMLDNLHQEHLNAKLLTFFGDESHFYLWTTKKAPDNDFDGFTLRTSKIYDTFFQGLGANTATIQAPEVYTALERGTVDGTGWPLWGVVGDFGWHEFLNYRYGPGFFNVVVNVLMNQDKYSSLTNEQRTCVDDMALWAEEVWPEWRAEKDEEVKAKLEEVGIEYIDLGDDFRQTAHDLYWEALMKDSPETVGKLKDLLTK